MMGRPIFSFTRLPDFRVAHKGDERVTEQIIQSDVSRCTYPYTSIYIHIYVCK